MQVGFTYVRHGLELLEAKQISGMWEEEACKTIDEGKTTKDPASP